MNRIFFTLWFALGVFGWPVYAAAQSIPDAGFQAGGEAMVVSVIDGDTLALEDGRTVRLVGLQAPKLPLGREGFRAWPYSVRAKAALETLVVGRRVRLYFGGDQTDRWRRKLAHLERDDGLWVQGKMLGLGLARVYSFADNRKAVAEMLAIERAAREDRRGIWSHPFYALRTPAETFQHLNSFQIVEGRVVAAAKVKGVVYLNFDEDWRTDFTVRIPRNVRRMFEKQDIDPILFEGKMIRARGWIKSWNGPMIELSHPEQLESLEP